MSSPTTSQRRPLRVIANRTACCGYGICAEICPEVFRLDDAGVVTVLTEIVPEGLEEKARESVAACPLSALEAQDE